MTLILIAWPISLLLTWMFVAIRSWQQGFDAGCRRVDRARQHWGEWANVRMPPQRRHDDVRIPTVEELERAYHEAAYRKE